jgi:hypothetical protein
MVLVSDRRFGHGRSLAAGFVCPSQLQLPCQVVLQMVWRTSSHVPIGEEKLLISERWLGAQVQ